MLGRLFTPATEERAQATTWGTWPGDNGGSSSPVVTQTNAMQLLAVSGSVRLITDSIATLPVDTFREVNGVREEIAKPMWLKQPTVDLDFVAWATQVLTSLLLHGNAYCVVTRNGTQIVELVPVDPSLVSVSRVNGRKTFIVGGREFRGEIWHIPAMMLPGSEVGLAPLEYARQTFGLGLSAQGFAQDQFDSSLNMPGVIEIPKRAQPEQMLAMAASWRKARTKRGRGLPGVLEDGATWKATGVSNEAAQFLQTQQWTAAQIAAQVYMVDPSDLGIPVGGTTLTYANLEQRNIRRLQVTFLPWIIRLEKALSVLLPQPRFVKFNTDGLLRGDSAARWTVYGTAMDINVKAASIGMPPVVDTAEMRDWEDLSPYDGPTVETPDVVEPQMLSATPDINVTVNMPEARSEAPVVNVTNDVHVPEQRTPDVHVTNEPAAVVVDVQPTTVTVPGAEVRYVQEAPEVRRTVRSVERDESGRIVRVIDEEIADG